MGISKITKVNMFFAGIIMIAIFLCFSSQVKAAQAGDYVYTATAGAAQITKYTGVDKNITIPSKLDGVPVTSIGDNAFNGNKSLISVNIAPGVTSIGNGAFLDCKGLTTVFMPQGVTNIGDEAFNGCSRLTKISIPSGVTSIGKQAFAGCRSLTSISVDVNNLNYASIDGVLFNKAGTVLMAFPGGLATVSIPQAVTSIGDEAFYNCPLLTTISIPPGVTSIGNNAFFGCKGLTSISIPPGVISIGDAAFRSCTGLTTISLPAGVTSIGSSAFNNCTVLTSISIPSGVKKINRLSFNGCTGLTSITLNSAKTAIYDDALTIPNATEIIGYDPSFAKDYATKYGRTFEVIGTIHVKVNGIPVVFDQPPAIINNRTLVPLRAIFEALGASVNWDEATQQVTATKGDIIIIVKIGSTQATVSGETKTLDVPAQILNNRTLVPVRFISESLGAKVDWDEASQTVLITK